MLLFTYLRISFQTTKNYDSLLQYTIVMMYHKNETENETENKKPKNNINIDIDHYVSKLIDNLPDTIKNKTQNIDLVLDGGVFNGSYLVGILYFLKEMERRKYIQIKRISGCSIGSVVGLLYFIDALDMMPELYELANKDLNEHYSLKLVTDMKKHIQHKIPDDICCKIRNKFFICYNNVKKQKKIVKSKYKNIDDLINTIIKSCYVPYLIDGNLLYQNKYFDGVNPYTFEKKPDRKILHINLFGYENIMNVLNIKNEKTNFHRILTGLLDVHNFYIKGSKTTLCNYVDNRSIIDHFSNHMKLFMEKLIFIFIHMILYLKKYMPHDIDDYFIVKVLSNITRDIFILLLKTYFI